MSITPLQYKQLQQRLSTPRRTASPVFEPMASGRGAGPCTILGLDPSLRGTGYGVIRSGKPYPATLEHGRIACAAGWSHSRCLVRIMEGLREVLERHRPTVCAIEGLFYAQNLQTALTMGEARGAAIATIASAGVEIYEIAPRKVKQAIVGYGAAQKLAVAKMVQRMLHLSETPGPDAADALALALTQAQESSRYSLSAAKRI